MYHDYSKIIFKLHKGETMNEQVIQNTIENLKSDEALDVRITKKKKSLTPPYLIIGNGKSSRHFKNAPVVDTLKVLSTLSPQQFEIFLHFRDLIVENTISSSQADTINKHPNTVTLSKSNNDIEAKRVKALLRTNNNGRKMQDLMIIKKIKIGVYMVNPYMIIPTNDFEEAVNEWDAII